MKTCTKCGEDKWTAEFYKDAQKRDGLSSSCKLCSNIAISEYRAANKDKVKAQLAKYRAANSGKIKAYASEYRSANYEKCKAAIAKWGAANKEKSNARALRWRAANPDKAKASVDKYREVNRYAYLSRHRVHQHNRRTCTDGKLSTNLSAKLFKLQRGKCACGCGRLLGDDYHMDHRMPLALGGANEDWNMQLLTATCNLKKGAKHPIDFMQQRGFLL